MALRACYASNLMPTQPPPMKDRTLQVGYFRYWKRGVVVSVIVTHEEYSNVQFYFTTMTTPAPSDPANGMGLQAITLRAPQEIRSEGVSRLLRQAVKRTGTGLTMGQSSHV